MPNLASLGGFLPLIGMLIVFYLFLIIPENKRKKKYNEMINNLRVNDEIITRGGIIGKIVNIQDDFVIVESGPDKGRFKLSKQGISNLVTKTEETEK
ncbi:preprotein translocase subunit YajC [Clostridium amylolyticum]|uniref:Preprotein translocase subunit YajC n=1 Tax=Clostridium amylolyticum TaxID=1121298 RepID=A0A1M6CVY3_9CLOT|nr:preprotein translocase subunit YajC [Clostridium amylolyticum]SHI64964.1 preprotein translocase subunit YajC [Clostridium amylolyticum]